MRFKAFAFDAARSRDDLLGTCSQVPFLGSLEIRFHQQAEAQLISSNPKTVDPNALSNATKKDQSKRPVLNLLKNKIRLSEIYASKIFILISYKRINTSSSRASRGRKFQKKKEVDSKERVCL